MKITKQILLSMCLCGDCSYSIYFSSSSIYIYNKIENNLYFIAWHTHELKSSKHGAAFISGSGVRRPRTKEELLDFVKNVNGYTEIISK